MQLFKHIYIFKKFTLISRGTQKGQRRSQHNSHHCANDEKTTGRPRNGRHCRAVCQGIGCGHIGADPYLAAGHQEIVRASERSEVPHRTSSNTPRVGCRYTIAVSWLDGGHLLGRLTTFEKKKHPLAVRHYSITKRYLTMDQCSSDYHQQHKHKHQQNNHTRINLFIYFPCQLNAKRERNESQPKG